MFKNFQNHYFRALDTNQKIVTITRKTYNQEKNNYLSKNSEHCCILAYPGHLPSLSSVVDFKKTASISSTDTNSGDSRTGAIHTQRCVVACFDISAFS